MKIELLAPAKNLETAIAAINYGADAIYIGAPKFGARSAVGNSIEDIQELVKYAHKYWAKVFVTINTIIYENELKDVEKLIHELYRIKVDAIIVQDMGVLELDLPPISLHASTQTHNYDLDRIQFLEKVGFERIILARELSLDQIKNIRKNTSIELEYFVNGALCVSLSGQCYFSHATTGRSANRGECSQACRMKYKLEDEKGNIISKEKYLLSLKDLNLSKKVGQIAKAGICSLKIEGRLKDISYIKNIVSEYRKNLDKEIRNSNYLKKASSGTTEISFTPDPERTFNRGFTSYFFDGRTSKIANFETPKSMGKKIGTVLKVGKDHFTTDSKLQINNGDGLCFVNQKGQLSGLQVNQVKSHKIYPNDMNSISEGCVVYRNNDHEFSKTLKQDRAKRKINLIFDLTYSGNNLNITATDEDNIQISHKIEGPFEIASNIELAHKNMEAQFRKSGDSIFSIAEVNINFEETPFIQAKTLNLCRRECLELMETKRIEFVEKPKSKPIINHPKYPKSKLSFKANVVNSKAKEFYKQCGVSEIQDGFELLKNTDGKMLMNTRHCLRHEFGLCPKQKSKIKNTNDPLYLVDTKNKYRLEFDCIRCEMKIYQE